MAEPSCADEDHPLKRFLLIVSSVLACAGCQSADPLAAFGPYRVPAPTTAQPAPYYPANGTAAPVVSEKAAPTRVSVSAEGPLVPASQPRFAAEPSDREPIRVVENPTANTRTAAAPSRTTPAEPPPTTPSSITATSR
jgi:hypothetical protein